MHDIILTCLILNITIFWFYSFIWGCFNVEEFHRTKHLISDAAFVQLYTIPLNFIFGELYTGLQNVNDLFIYNLFKFGCMFLYHDFIFYYIHRSFHHIPLLYKFHKKHHSIITTTPWSSLFASKTENILLNYLPVLTAPIVVQIHINWLPYWTIISTLYSLISHSNFNTKHNIHHTLQYVNFGDGFVFDKIYETEFI